MKKAAINVNKNVIWDGAVYSTIITKLINKHGKILENPGF